MTDEYERWVQDYIPSRLTVNWTPFLLGVAFALFSLIVVMILVWRFL